MTKKVKVQILHDGDLSLVVDSRYKAKKKDKPKDLPEKITVGKVKKDIVWLFSFGFYKDGDKNQTLLKDTIPTYEIRVVDNPDQTLYYWCSNDQEAQEVPSQKIITVNETDYRTGELTLADPPIGWS